MLSVCGAMPNWLALGRDRRIMRQAERELALCEGLVEPVGRQVERHRARRQHAPGERVHGVGVVQHVARKPGQLRLVRPQIGADEAPARAAQRIVRRALALDEEGLVQVGLVVVVDVRRPHRVAAHRHVAVVVLVQLAARACAAIGRSCNRRASAKVRAISGCGTSWPVSTKKPTVVSASCTCARRRLQRAGPAGEVVRDIDHRNGSGHGQVSSGTVICAIDAADRSDDAPLSGVSRPPIAEIAMRGAAHQGLRALQLQPRIIALAERAVAIARQDARRDRRAPSRDTSPHSGSA